MSRDFLEDFSPEIREYVESQGESFANRVRLAREHNMYPAEAYQHQELSIVRDYFQPGYAARLVGRIMNIRKHKSVSFLDLEQGGNTIQIKLSPQRMGEEAYNLFHETISRSDYIGVEGEVIQTRHDEKAQKVSVDINSYTPLSKTLKPLPEFGEFKDPEQRMRRRPADLSTNVEYRRRLEQCSDIVQAIRNYLLSESFIENPTNILQPIYGGASARPFVTHHNDLDMQMYLRIAPELYLKRSMMCGGRFERNFEFSKNFRNEGVDSTHNPEFTGLEIYEAFSDMYGMMQRAEDIFKAAAQVVGKDRVMFKGNSIDLTRPWYRISMKDAIRDIGEISIDLDDRDAVMAHAKLISDTPNDIINPGVALVELFESAVEHKLVQPTIIYGYPSEVSPLAKRYSDDPTMAHRFEGFISGTEFANAFSELNDPIVQRAAFLQQKEALDAGDDEAQPIDEEFIRDMEGGMPQAGGLGIGIDRLNMLLTETDTIRDVIQFPTLRDR